MARKSSKHCVRPTETLFRPYKVSSAVHAVIFPTGDRTCDHRMQSRNSNREPLVHIAHKCCQINLCVL